MEAARFTLVQDLPRLAFPPGTTMAGGAGGLARRVCWAAVRPVAPASLAEVEEGELVILAGHGARDLAHEPRSLLSILAELGAAGVLIAEPMLTPEWAEAADAFGLPLFAVPGGFSPHALQRAVAMALLEGETQRERWGLQVYQRLAQVVADGRGFAGLGETAAQLSHRTVALLDEHSQVIHLALADPAANRGELLAAVRALRPTPARAEADDSLEPIHRLPLPGGTYEALIAPVVAGDAVAGSVCLVGPPSSLGLVDREFVGQAARAAALEVSRQQSVAEAENRMRGDFVEALLTGAYLNQEVLVRRARALGYTLQPPYAVLIFELATAEPEKAPLDPNYLKKARRWLEATIRQEMLRRHPYSLSQFQDNRVTVLQPAAGDAEATAIVHQAQTLIDRSRAWLEGVVVNAGISRVHPGLAGVQTSYREAEQALVIGRRLFGPGRATYFGNLGVFRLLFHLEGHAELSAFYQEVLVPLVEYDARHGSELVRTLTAFFDHLGNLSQVAERLFVHRNTLAYRLQRIEEITGLSLQDPEHRLCLQLALKVRELAPAIPAAPSAPPRRPERLLFSKDRLEP